MKNNEKNTAPNNQQNKKGKGKTIAIVVIVIILLYACSQAFGSNDTETSASSNNSVENTEASTSNTDNVENTETLEVTPTEVAELPSISESDSANIETESKDEESIPREYKSALNKAKTYSDMMHMSKKGLYNQLTSEYGEKFTAEAAQYAVDNVDADWKLNALEKAKTYQDTMDMSPEAIRDQLTSEYGEKFTAEEADYAISNLN